MASVRRASHLAFDGTSTDFSIERNASCVPIAITSGGDETPADDGEPRNAVRSSLGSVPCKFHVPMKRRSLA